MDLEFVSVVKVTAVELKMHQPLTAAFKSTHYLMLSNARVISTENDSVRIRTNTVESYECSTQIITSMTVVDDD